MPPFNNPSSAAISFTPAPIAPITLGLIADPPESSPLKRSVIFSSRSASMPIDPFTYHGTQGKVGSGGNWRTNVHWPCPATPKEKLSVLQGALPLLQLNESKCDSPFISGKKVASKPAI